MKTRTGVIMLAAAGIAMASGSGSETGQSGREKALASLIEAERAFSRLAEAKGIREAFLTCLAPDAVVFRPGPVEGRPVYEKMDPANPAVLTWEPEFAEASSSGELGYTTGPYRHGPSRGVDATRFGRYVSIWKKQSDGAWKVILDIGIEHDRPESAATVQSVAAPQARAAFDPLSPEALRDEERLFAQRAGSFEEQAGRQGHRKALAMFATADVRVYRPGRLPSVGQGAINGLVPAGAGRVGRGDERRRASFHVGMSWSGDLAYNYGTAEFRKNRATVETTAYLRIWRKEAPGIWKICLDIELPVSPS